MTSHIEQVLISPRYLAGPGDPAWVTVPLHEAAGWSHGHDPLLPQVILSSPDQKTLLRLEPTPDEPWWRLTHSGGSDGPSWYASFGARTPVELIAAVTDTLTDPGFNARAASDPNEPLLRAGWGRAKEGGLAPPDGIVRVDRFNYSGSDHWCIEAALGQAPEHQIWQARFGGNAPVRLVAAFTRALSDPEPLRRSPEQRPTLGRSRITFRWQEWPADQVGYALRERVNFLAPRHASAPPPPPPTRPPTPRRRTR